MNFYINVIKICRARWCVNVNEKKKSNVWTLPEQRPWISSILKPNLLYFMSLPILNLYRERKKNSIIASVINSGWN